MQSKMNSVPFLRVPLFISLLYCSVFAQTPNPDHSKEGFVIEQITDDVVFSAGRTGQEQRALRIRIQSDAAVQQLGILTFAYQTAFERVESIKVLVKKTDGSVITTPDSEIRDAPAPITLSAPAFSDSRIKQVPCSTVSRISPRKQSRPFRKKSPAIREMEAITGFWPTFKDESDIWKTQSRLCAIG